MGFVWSSASRAPAADEPVEFENLNLPVIETCRFIGTGHTYSTDRGKGPRGVETNLRAGPA